MARTIDFNSNGVELGGEDETTLQIKTNGNTVLEITNDALTIPSSNSASEAASGTIRYNSETNRYQLYDGFAWVTIV